MWKRQTTLRTTSEEGVADTSETISGSQPHGSNIRVLVRC